VEDFKQQIEEFKNSNYWFAGSAARALIFVNAYQADADKQLLINSLETVMGETSPFAESHELEPKLVFNNILYQLIEQAKTE